MSAGASTGVALVGDIGGTNARFGLVDLAKPAAILDARSVPCADHPEALSAIRAYLGGRTPDRAVLAVAGPVEDGRAGFTNMGWTLSEAELERSGLGRARLINDYVAQALAAPLLGAEDLRALGPRLAGDPGAPIAVLGPGTGFGVAALARDGSEAEIPLATEGGHMSFAPVDEIEVDVLRRLRARHGRVSVERILSGPGLRDLHQALQPEADDPGATLDPAEITRRAGAGDPVCTRTVERFCAILGSVAGDLALVFGARGGVFIGGGIPPLLLDFLQKGDFRRRFEDKGRFRQYVAAIPTWVVVRPHAALLGAARAAATL